MNTLYKQLKKEEDYLQKSIAILKSRLKNGPEGILEISHSKDRAQYYRRDPAKNGNRAKRKYIRKNDEGIAQSMAQRDYDRKLLAELEIRKKAVEKAVQAYETTSPEKVAARYSDARQKLIRPLILSDKQFIDQWMAEEYDSKPFRENIPEIHTAKGERVRSKSEKIIADTLFRYSIPYKYEYPVELAGLGLIYPDFLVLNPNTRKQYFWEHLGMMDDDNYVRNAISRIHAYEKNDIIPGRDLIITVETRALPLSNKTMSNIDQN